MTKLKPKGIVLELETYNVCNLGPQPTDYAERLSATETRHWLHLFHDPSTIPTIVIDNPNHLKVLQQAFQIGHQTRRVPACFAEDLQDMATDIQRQGNKSFAFDSTGLTKYFVRAENVSLKSGIHGAGPYSTVLQMLESIVTCRHGHSPIVGASDNAENNKSGASLPPPVDTIKLYLLPWHANLSAGLEFRVFVHNRRVTAVSQQNCYTVDERYANFDTTELVSFCNTCIDKLAHTDLVQKFDGFTMDIACFDKSFASRGAFNTGEVFDENKNATPEESYYFIEVNGFGAPYSAGSALFHWLKDDMTCVNEYRYAIYPPTIEDNG